MDYSSTIEEFIILAPCPVLQRAKLYPPLPAFITGQYLLIFQCYGVAFGPFLSRHMDSASFPSALLVLLHFLGQSWELFMDTRALLNPLNSLVHPHIIDRYGTAKPILLQMEILQCSLACLLHENNIFNKIIIPEELLRCFEFIPTHSEPQKILQIY